MRNILRFPSKQQRVRLVNQHSMHVYCVDGPIQQHGMKNHSDACFELVIFGHFFDDKYDQRTHEHRKKVM
jgi:hypothetical protein